jgi:mannose-1-phosphate guanylyltransferase
MVVLCGGKGQRLGSLTQDIPKPLLPIAGAPFLLRLLHQWKKEGVKRFILSTHVFADQFRGFAQKNSNLAEIIVVEEPQPLGTGQAVQSESFLAANGDSYVT